MLPMIYVALFLVVHIIRNEAAGFNSYFAIQINEYPKSSCHEISNIKSKFRCLGTCSIIMDMIVMISHDESTEACMCCSDITGSDMTGPTGNLMSHVLVSIFFYKKKINLSCHSNNNKVWFVRSYSQLVKYKHAKDILE